MVVIEAHKAPDMIIEALHACIRRGNLSVHSDDPITTALWMGVGMLLKSYIEMKSRLPEALATGEGIRSIDVKVGVDQQAADEPDADDDDDATPKKGPTIQ